VIPIDLIPKLRNYMIAFDQFLDDLEREGKLSSDAARREGYDNGFISGKITGFKEGRDAGFRDGYDQGYAAGRRAQGAEGDEENESEKLADIG
jgi:flagellar biosynthesis/type III secretory pathway protein FliH